MFRSCDLCPLPHTPGGGQLHSGAIRAGVCAEHTLPETPELVFPVSSSHFPGTFWALPCPTSGGWWVPVSLLWRGAPGTETRDNPVPSLSHLPSSLLLSTGGWQLDLDALKPVPQAEQPEPASNQVRPPHSALPRLGCPKHSLWGLGCPAGQRSAARAWRCHCRASVPEGAGFPPGPPMGSQDSSTLTSDP